MAQATVLSSENWGLTLHITEKQNYGIDLERPALSPQTLLT